MSVKKTKPIPESPNEIAETPPAPKGGPWTPEGPKGGPWTPEDAEERGSIVREYRRVMYQYSFIGIELGVAILVGYFLGRWIDGQLGSSPWAMLITTALCIFAALRDFVRLIRKAGAAAKEASSEDETEET